MDEIETPVSEKKSHTPSDLVWWRNKLLAGLFIAIPLAVTFKIIELIYKAISWTFDPVVKAFVKEYRIDLVEGGGFIPNEIILNDTIPFAAFFITILFILVLGLLVTNVFGRRILEYIERALLRIPLVNLIYPLAKQVVDSIKMIGANSGAPQPGDSRQVVYIQYPGLGGYLVAFQTGRFKDKQGQEFVSVFIPTAPNPITGFVLIFKESEVMESDLSMEDAWKLLVSAGFVTPPGKLTSMPVLEPMPKA